jgi:Fe-S-cluster containining protein
MLENFKSTLSAEGYQNILLQVNTAMREILDKLTPLKPGTERGKMAHELIDEQNVKYADATTTCQKGCAYCCHLEVEITEDDAEVVADAIIRGNLSYDKKRLQAQAERANKADIWLKGAIPDNRCVLLDESGSCRIYEDRPTTCRKHAVFGPAKDCAELSESLNVRLIPMNEIIMSVHTNLPGHTFGTFPKLVHAALEKRKGIKPIEPEDSSIEVVVIKPPTRHTNHN